MTKKTMSQNEENHPQTYSTNITTTDISENSINNQKILINKSKIEYEYYTPIKKKIKRIPSTPKKKKRTTEYQDLPINGTNLLSIFESM